MSKRILTIRDIEQLAKRIVRESRLQKDPQFKNVPEHVIKVQEEVGELAVAYLMSINKKGHKKTKKEVKENFIEEISDCILILLSLVGRAGYTYEKLLRTLNFKYNKRLGQAKK